MDLHLPVFLTTRSTPAQEIPEGDEFEALTIDAHQLLVQLPHLCRYRVAHHELGGGVDPKLPDYTVEARGASRSLKTRTILDASTKGPKLLLSLR